MKTKAGKRVLRDISKDKAEVHNELEKLAKEFAALKPSKKNHDEAYMYRMLQRAESYKKQLEIMQGYVNTACYLESLLKEGK